MFASAVVGHAAGITKPWEVSFQAYPCFSNLISHFLVNSFPFHSDLKGSTDPFLTTVYYYPSMRNVIHSAYTSKASLCPRGYLR